MNWSRRQYSRFNDVLKTLSGRGYLETGKPAQAAGGGYRKAGKPAQAAGRGYRATGKSFQAAGGGCRDSVTCLQTADGVLLMAVIEGQARFLGRNGRFSPLHLTFHIF